jgi:pimeloyl-ACP methyl ester carboxylesterase
MIKEAGRRNAQIHPTRGDRDIRAPLTVAQDLHTAISGSTLVVLPATGHLCNIEAPGQFNRAVREFLPDRRS